MQDNGSGSRRDVLRYRSERARRASDGWSSHRCTRRTVSRQGDVNADDRLRSSRLVLDQALGHPLREISSTRVPAVLRGLNRTFAYQRDPTRDANGVCRPHSAAIRGSQPLWAVPAALHGAGKTLGLNDDPVTCPPA